MSIHEISHLIFFEQLKSLQKTDSVPKELSKDLIHYYKESLTAVLLNEKPLVEILGIKNYRGNPGLKNLNLKVGGKLININDYLRVLYQKSKKEKSFLAFLEESINSLAPYSQEFSQKWKLWSQSNNKQEISKEYSTPIALKK